MFLFKRGPFLDSLKLSKAKMLKQKFDMALDCYRLHPSKWSRIESTICKHSFFRLFHWKIMKDHVSVFV